MFFNRVKVEQKEINEAYKEFEKDTDIIFLCVDEDIRFDTRHIEGAQCYPLRLIERNPDLPKNAIYYVYSINKGRSYEGCKQLLKKGYKAYDCGSFVDYKGPEEGLEVKKKKRRRK